MTGKERNILDRIEEKVDRLMENMATSNERARGCERRFIDLEAASKWTRGKVILILGFGAGLGFAAGIVVNRNAVPFDKLGPTVTSGMRLGTPAVTTRGFGTAEIKQVAGLIIKIIQHPADTAVTAQAREEVAAICARLPIPGIND